MKIRCSSEIAPLSEKGSIRKLIEFLINLLLLSEEIQVSPHFMKQRFVLVIKALGWKSCLYQRVSV